MHTPDSQRSAPYPIAWPASVAATVSFINAIVALSAVVLAVLSLVNKPPAWFLFPFEVAIAIAGVLGLLMGMGKFRDGAALGLLSIAGCIAVGSLLGYLGAGKTLLGVSLQGVLYGRAAAALVLLMMAGVVVIMSHPGRSLRNLSKGGLLGGSFAAVCAGAWGASGWMMSAPGVVQAVLIVVVGGLALGLLAASAHLVVRAFSPSRAGE